MSLSHPALNTTGKKRGKQKFASAAAKAQSQQLEQQWLALKKQHGVVLEEKHRSRGLAAEPLVYKLTTPPGRDAVQLSSRDTGWVACTRAPDKVYTGDKIVGVATMHKSNAVPVFSNEQARDISSMRR
jgi:hypothetical protein